MTARAFPIPMGVAMAEAERVTFPRATVDDLREYRHAARDQMLRWVVAQIGLNRYGIPALLEPPVDDDDIGLAVDRLGWMAMREADKPLSVNETKLLAACLRDVLCARLLMADTPIS